MSNTVVGIISLVAGIIIVFSSIMLIRKKKPTHVDIAEKYIYVEDEFRKLLVMTLGGFYPHAVKGKIYKASIIFRNDINDPHPDRFVPSLMKGMATKITEVTPALLDVDGDVEWVEVRSDQWRPLVLQPRMSTKEPGG